jgi:hypothetical protein
VETTCRIYFCLGVVSTSPFVAVKLSAVLPIIDRLAAVEQTHGKVENNTQRCSSFDVDRQRRASCTIAAPPGDYFVEVGITDRLSSAGFQATPERRPAAEGAIQLRPTSFKLLPGSTAQRVRFTGPSSDRSGRRLHSRTLALTAPSSSC